MIEKLLLQNFQSHKKSELVLDPGVNVIVGDSNAGKTAILRALYWLIFGKPSGTTIVRHNIKTNCTVSAALSTGEEVTRVRGKTDNFYDLDGQVYKGFGQNVPEPVVNAFNMSDINFARQLDAPFLLSKSAGDVAQYLNKLVNLEAIGTSLSNISSLSRNWSREKSSLASRIEDLKEDLAKMDWVECADKKLRFIEKKNENVLKTKTVVSRISRELATYHRAQEQLDELPDHRPLEKRLNKINKLMGGHKTTASTLKTLQDAVEAHNKAFAALCVLEPYKPLDKRILEVERKIEKTQALLNKKQTLKALLTDFVKKENATDVLLFDEEVAQKRYYSIMPEVCPLCDQPIGEKGVPNK